MIVVRFNQQDRIGTAVGYPCQIHLLLGTSLEKGVFTDRDEEMGLPVRLLFGIRSCVNGGHTRDQLFIVFAVPGLIEVELFIKLVLLYIGKKMHAPAQEWFAVLIIIG